MIRHRALALLALLALILLALLCTRACAISPQPASPPSVDHYIPTYPKPEYPAP